MNAWKAAFAKADEVNTEVLSPIVVPMVKKRTRNDDHDSEDETGAFKQPKKLAEFVASLKSDSPPETVNITIPLDTDVSGPISEVDLLKSRKSLEERCAVQICRNWLKHTYLQIGKPCNNPNCPRLHEIKFHPGRLYNDFSFKGLASQQQKTIINKVLAEQNDSSIKEKEEEEEVVSALLPEVALTASAAEEIPSQPVERCTVPMKQEEDPKDDVSTTASSSPVVSNYDEYSREKVRRLFRKWVYEYRL